MDVINWRLGSEIYFRLQIGLVLRTRSILESHVSFWTYLRQGVRPRESTSKLNPTSESIGNFPYKVLPKDRYNFLQNPNHVSISCQLFQVLLQSPNLVNIITDVPII